MHLYLVCYKLVENLKQYNINSNVLILLMTLVYDNMNDDNIMGSPWSRLTPTIEPLFTDNILSYIPFNIILPDNIRESLKNIFNVSIEKLSPKKLLSVDEYKSYIYDDYGLKEKLLRNRNIMSVTMEQIETNVSIGNYMEQQMRLMNPNLTYHVILFNDNITMFVTKDIIAFKMNQLIIMYNNKFIAINNNDKMFIDIPSGNVKMLINMSDDKKCNAYIESKNFTEYIDVKEDMNNNIYKNASYKSKLNGTIKNATKYDCINQVTTSVTVKNNNYISCITSTKDNIVECTKTVPINSNGTIRNRHIGTSISTTTDKMSSLKLYDENNDLVYQKDDNEEKVNLLIKDKNKNNTDDMYGWKKTKTNDGYDRIIKLFIPKDMKKIMGIGKDFFDTYHKKRCSGAIVVDIQEYDRDNIISLVKTENKTYSCLHENVITEYILGQMVVPDGFNENENDTCGQGIHYFSDREDVFNYFDRFTI